MVAASNSIIVVEGLDGAGKTTLARELSVTLTALGRTSLPERLARLSVELFRELTEHPEIPQLMHQTIVPGPFRHLSYIVEAVAQFGYRAELYEQYDTLVFDRWVQTYTVYCALQPAFGDFAQRLLDLLPVPAHIIYLTIPPEIAFERLVARRDPWYQAFGPDDLMRRLRVFHGRYDDLLADQEDVTTIDGTLPRAEVLKAAVASTAGIGQPDPIVR